MTDQDKRWTEHLSEMRTRILWVFAFFVVFLIVGFVSAKPIIDWMKADILSGTMGRNLELHIFSPGETISIFMQFAFVVSLVLTSPVALYQAWRFVRPGLTDQERRVTLGYIPVSVLLLVAGLLFGYFLIFPFIIGFLTTLTASLGATETYGMYEFFRFLFRIVIPIGLLFELPVIILFLTRLRILNPEILKKGRKFAYLAMVVLAAMITPPDFISNILVAIPLIALYEVSILFSMRIYRKMKAEEEAVEQSWRERGAVIRPDDDWGEEPRD
ncbi:twin-arginine translocase subunit TatC [Desmospora profundinema]|uniref:Sec-independent protein translocase protein TatC n=1 Tax=Desmospora profundinema TaxID=1571184 RepID=A0ABU1IRU8_9BACL|nr:twin-arginine translocase subunit TatC [Desmospora profundinema]MDR6227521.1 sec-independent protein translocase protein TatC [Desmospora profundinema]